MERIQQLAIPLNQGQINAAIEFADGGSEPTFELLEKTFPDHEAVLIKAIVLNELYSTSIIAIIKAADCVERVLLRTNHQTGPDLVEELVKEIHGVTKQDNYSFASKYAHFFVNPSIPILDSNATWMVGKHLGRQLQSKDKHKTRYQRFTEDIATLMRLAGLKCSPRELDCYLWVAAAYWWWKGDPRYSIKSHPKYNPNGDLKQDFVKPAKASCLARLLGIDAEGVI